MDTKIVKDKRYVAMVVDYRFTDDTKEDIRKSFEAMLSDLAFAEERPGDHVRTLSQEYVADIKPVRKDIKAWMEQNAEGVSKGSRIIIYYAKPGHDAMRMRVYTFE